MFIKDIMKTWDFQKIIVDHENKMKNIKVFYYQTYFRIICYYFGYVLMTIYMRIKTKSKCIEIAIKFSPYNTPQMIFKIISILQK